MKKRVIVMGGIGRTERENRDDMRVFSRGGYAPTLKAHIATEKPMVIRKWKRKS
jgi:hypothetical protein